MTENELLISRARDLKVSAADNSVPTATCFLTESQRAQLSVLKKEQSAFVDTFFFGGYVEAERTAAVFIPKFFEAESAEDFFRENPELCPFSLLMITKDRFSSLSHRDYLGALMGLGIRREMLGDIIVTQGGCFVPCADSVADYICKNLTSAGRGTVSVCRVGFDRIEERREYAEHLNVCVASMRLDNLVSACFSVSRAAAVEAICKGVVFVDSEVKIKPDCKIEPGAKIVLRGKGKTVVEEISGESKKGRLHVKIKKYI